jgi:hypothetical protein
MHLTLLNDAATPPAKSLRAARPLPPRQQIRVDFIVAKIGFVLAEAETAKPPADIHGRAPHGLSE